MEKTKIIDELNQLINKGNDILKTEHAVGGHGIPAFKRVNQEQFMSWRTSIKSFLNIFLEKDSDFFEPFIKTENSPNNALIFLETLKK